MNRLEFMQRLEQLLSDISAKEKEEALKYYNDYLNDAGVENEEEVLMSLGSPEKVAKIIKEGLYGGSFYGEFTETGFKDAVSEAEKKNEVDSPVNSGNGPDAGPFSSRNNSSNMGAGPAYGNSGYQGNPYKTHYKGTNGTFKQDGKKMSGGMIALIVILCILASPLLGGAIGLVFGLAGGLIGLVVGTAALGVGLLVAAVFLVGIGIGELFVTPLIGLCLIGVGLLLGGFAVLFLGIVVWLCGTAFPWLFCKVKELFRNLVHRKGEESI